MQSPLVCGRKATLIEIRQALSNGAACELEGLPSAFGGLLPHCAALSGLLPERKSQFQSDQPENGQSIETTERRFRNWRGHLAVMVRGYEVAKGHTPEWSKAFAKVCSIICPSRRPAASSTSAWRMWSQFGDILNKGLRLTGMRQVKRLSLGPTQLSI